MKRSTYGSIALGKEHDDYLLDVARRIFVAGAENMGKESNREEYVGYANEIWQSHFKQEASKALGLEG